MAGQPGITAPILGVTNPHHLTDAIAAFDLELSSAEQVQLTEHHTPRFATGVNRSRTGAAPTTPS